MPVKISGIRQSKFNRQSGRCYYCEQPMWTGSPAGFCRKHGVSAKKARLFQCTGEHLTARCDGGRYSPDNIVAACRFCNMTRHRAKTPLAAERYRQRVRRRFLQGHWFRL